MIGDSIFREVHSPTTIVPCGTIEPVPSTLELMPPSFALILRWLVRGRHTVEPSFYTYFRATLLKYWLFAPSHLPPLCQLKQNISSRADREHAI